MIFGRPDRRMPNAADIPYARDPGTHGSLFFVPPSGRRMGTTLCLARRPRFLTRGGEGFGQGLDLG